MRHYHSSGNVRDKSLAVDRHQSATLSLPQAQRGPRLRYGNIRYFHRIQHCSTVCGASCKEIDADNFYNALLFSRPMNRSALVDEFYANGASKGAICDFDVGYDPLRNRVLQRLFISDLCNNECFFGCARHAPTHEERKTLLEHDWKGILLYECAPFPPWMAILCVAVFVVAVIVILVVIRVFARRKSSNKESERGMPQVPASTAPRIESLECARVSIEERKASPGTTLFRDTPATSCVIATESEARSTSSSATAMRSSSSSSPLHHEAPMRLLLLLVVMCVPLAESLDFRARNVRPDDYRNVQSIYSNPYQQFASQQPSAQSYFPPVYEPQVIPYYETSGTTSPPLYSPTPSRTSLTPSTKTTLGAVKITRQTVQPKKGKGTARLSKMPKRMENNGTSTLSKRKGSSAHISVPSHRLLNDILVIPSEQRLYILAVMPIHESAKSQGFECGNLDVNAFLRLSAFLTALEDVNASPSLREANLHVGAVIIDSCASDLRAVADLYELLSGTNIEKSDIIAIVRDDDSFLPNVDEFVRHLRLPTLNTFFSPRPQLLTTGTLPGEEKPLEAILDLMLHMQSTCISVVFDDQHADSVKALAQLAEARGICLDQEIAIQAPSTVETQQNALRKLVLSEARIVLVLYGDKSWIDLLNALNLEMVIPGRFVFVAIQNDLWTTSRQYLELWPHFDQLLLSVEHSKSANHSYMSDLTRKFSKYPYPQHWLRQFWSTAFHCHIDGERMPGEQFSRPCPHQQSLNISFVAPDLDVTPITLAVHAIGHSLRKLADNVCPGALIHTLTDCLNEPYRSLFAAVMSVEFYHPLMDADTPFSINASTGFADAPLRLNRVAIDRGAIRFDEIARWDAASGLLYTAGQDLVVEERDGRRVKVQSTCPKSACSSESTIRAKIGTQPTFKAGLHDMGSLVFSAVATLLTFLYLMCMYQQLVGARHDPYRICTMIMFSGLACLSTVSIFFIMQPSWITCAIRRNFFSVAVALVFAPILVKSIAIWHHEVLHLRKLSPPTVSSVALFWMSVGLVFAQIVVVAEWSLFEDPTLLEFVPFREVFAWRCTPGNRFEQRLFLSLALDIVAVVISLLVSVLSLRNVHSRQNVLSCTAAIAVGVALYVCLPLTTFRLRDQIFAGVLLVYTVLVLVIIYCRRGFVGASSIASGKENLVNEPSPMDSDKMSQFGADRSQAWQNPYTSSTLHSQPGVHRQHSMMDYTISSRKIPSVSYLPAAGGTIGQQSEYRTPNTRM